MAKLTKAQRAALAQVEAHLARGVAYLQSDKIAIAQRGKNNATTTLHFTRGDGATLYEVNKDIGSNLTGVFEALRLLSRFNSEA